MGTTVTTNLGLIKPDSSEKIKQDLPTYAGWADQNADNCDVLDALFRRSTHTSWTPAWTASVNPVLGSGGFVEGKYIRLFPRMLIGFLRIEAGTAGFSAGSGAYSISAPVAIDSAIAAFANEITIGKAVFRDNGASSTTSAFQVVYSTSGGNIFFRQPSNDLWTAASPVALAQSDKISAYFMYPVSAP